MATQKQLLYPVGTRYSNSQVYDEATDEVVHGWQVFAQKNPNGEPTGRKSFVDHNGMLCSVEIAEAKRRQAVKDQAENMLMVLQSLESQGWLDSLAEVAGGLQPTVVAQVRAVLALAAGVQSVNPVPPPVLYVGKAPHAHLYQCVVNGETVVRVYANDRPGAVQHLCDKGFRVTSIETVA